MRRLAVAAVCIVAVATAGAVLARARSGSGAPTRMSPAATAPASGALDESASAARTGDTAAARDAAVRAVARTGEVVRAGFISRRELIETFTTPGFAPTLTRTTSESVNAMLLELGEREADVAFLAVIEQPITATAEPSAGGVDVRVWSVLVVAVPGVGPGRQVWRTVTLDMVDSEGRWLVNGWSSTPGPSPAPPAEGAFDDALAFVEPMSWPPAGALAESGGAG